MEDSVDKKDVLIQQWMEKARRSLSAAETELASGNLDFSANRIYYAAFYAVTAALMHKGLRFKKHSAVRAAFHKEFIKTGIVPQRYGLLYDTIMQDREAADYLSFITIEEDVLKQEITEVIGLIDLLETIIENNC